jgi:uracil-DNA glycosylase family 4
MSAKKTKLLPVMATDLPGLTSEIIACRACPRLVRWREKVAREKRRAFRDWEYWGKPVAGFGDPKAKIVIIGLAPAAHGGNRTGRIFTGDMSGDFLFAGLHRAGIANQKESVSPSDGLKIKDTYILAAVRCAPPDNTPSPAEVERCSRFLDRELDLLPYKRVILALGLLAWTSYFRHLARRGITFRKRPTFAHGAHVEIGADVHLVGSYHVSAQNTLTGRLTPRMFDRVLAEVIKLAGLAIVLFALSCSNNPTQAARPPAPSGTAPGISAPVTSAAFAIDAAPVDAPVADASFADASVSDVAAPRIAPKKVLHVGDSMVGGSGGLSKALESRFLAMGSSFVRDWQTSISIQSFARDKHFAELLKKHDPDLVIITLGANDMLVPFPASLAPFVRAIARKAAGRECYWLPPVPWTKETGIIEVIKDNAAPCKVFDGSGLKIARAPDGIHPTDKGGADWASAFFAFYDGATLR